MLNIERITKQEAIELFKQCKLREAEVRDVLARCYQKIKQEAAAGEIGCEVDLTGFPTHTIDAARAEFQKADFMVRRSGSMLSIFWLGER